MTNVASMRWPSTTPATGIRAPGVAAARTRSVATTPGASSWPVVSAAPLTCMGAPGVPNSKAASAWARFGNVSS